MIKWFTGLFIKHEINPSDPKTRSAVGSLSGWVGIICNVLLFLGKLIVGIFSGSVSITADAMNNLSDASSSIVTLLGFKLAKKPADEDHPYGHARYEYLSGLAVAALILVIGFELAKASISKIITPTDVSFTAVTGAVLVVSIAVKLWLAVLNRKLGDWIHSATLTATAVDSRNDVLATSAVLLAAVIQHLTQWQVDGYIGLAVALFILYSGVSLGKQTISPLLGEAVSPELRQCIVDYISKQPKVLGYHDLMVHDYGPGRRFATLHVEMDNKEDPLLCHEIIDDMERECLQSHNIHLVIHYDPVVTDDPQTNRLLDSVRTLLQEYDPQLKPHDFRCVIGNEHTNLIFDVSLPTRLAGQEKAIINHLETALSAQEKMRIYTVITFDPAAFNQDDN